MTHSHINDYVYVHDKIVMDSPWYLFLMLHRLERFLQAVKFRKRVA
jgi:hypothetical protein